MDQNQPAVTQGVVVEEQLELTLLELCQASHAEEAFVIRWVREGALEPQGESPQNWRFRGDALRRARVAWRLSCDLEINPSGVALVLDLLDELQALRACLDRTGKH
ncbi:MerR family transcriptional regulator [Chromobacterium sinusclupearum]|uniref:MerR family transcriptional regulator n=1 Tax=Chromobacterium sinusclupearum TaxID=2077146 RepID=A0A2K4MKL9_9NEIS|nr:chaperone modulator CbpM [Chromobacterium sinusclupearum]POA97295.1 MerR family transcriptional regulator [Chromobacterium sinusclupearum]